MAIDNFGVLWIFSSDNDNRSYIIEKNGNQVKLVPSNCLNHSEKLLWTFVDGDFLYFIDSTYALYEFKVFEALYGLSACIKAVEPIISLYPKHIVVRLDNPFDEITGETMVHIGWFVQSQISAVVDIQPIA